MMLNLVVTGHLAKAIFLLILYANHTLEMPSIKCEGGEDYWRGLIIMVGGISK